MTPAIRKLGKLGPLMVSDPLRAYRMVHRGLTRRVQRALAVPASRSGFLASLYYTVCTRKFYREHRAVLAGTVAHLRADIAEQESSAWLRRNVHRLEKGLIMRPRRASFAADYIGETVRLFAGAVRAGSLNADERKWAGDVLVAYFRTVTDTPPIGAARKLFESLDYSSHGAAFTPYPRSRLEPSGVDFDALTRLFVERRSVRWFDGRPVPRELLAKAIDAASLAPSACNRQPYCFVVLSEPARAAEIAALAGGTAGYAHNLPCLIVVVGDLSAYVEERDRHLIYIDGALASMQLMLGLQTLGLSSCPINWPDMEGPENALANALGLAVHERAIMLIGVGYADPEGCVPFSQKKTSEMLMRTGNRARRQ